MPCPACGCSDGTSMGGDSRFGRQFTRIRCRNCGRIYRHDLPRKTVVETVSDAVDYHIIHCPKCNSENQAVYKTMRPVRYHRCKDCQHSFKSIETTA